MTIAKENRVTEMADEKERVMRKADMVRNQAQGVKKEKRLVENEIDVHKYKQNEKIKELEVEIFQTERTKRTAEMSMKTF